MQQSKYIMGIKTLSLILCSLLSFALDTTCLADGRNTDADAALNRIAQERTHETQKMEEALKNSQEAETAGQVEGKSPQEWEEEAKKRQDAIKGLDEAKADNLKAKNGAMDNEPAGKPNSETPTSDKQPNVWERTGKDSAGRDTFKNQNGDERVALPPEKGPNGEQVYKYIDPKTGLVDDARTQSATPTENGGYKTADGQVGNGKGWTENPISEQLAKLDTPQTNAGDSSPADALKPKNGVTKEKKPMGAPLINLEILNIIQKLGSGKSETPT